MGYSLVIFVILIIILSVLRSRLVYELSGASLLVFGSTKPGVVIYSLFVLPGTIIHELSHWIVAELLLVKTGEITIFPNWDESKGGRGRLGSVEAQRSDPFRGFLIGLAPFISGLGILIILGQLFSSYWDTNLPWWQLALIVYGIMVMGNSMMTSQEDRRTWPFIIVFFSFIIFLIFKYYPSLFLNHYPSIVRILLPLNQILGVTAGLNLVMIGALFATRRFIEKLTKRRIL